MRLRWLPVIALIALAVSMVCVYDRAVLHFLGWDGQSSDNYAAWSGSVPALFTLVGMSTLITGLWHHVNCRKEGCLRIGRHKVGGTSWCGRHHLEARPELTAEQLLTQILEELRSLREAG